MGIEVILIPTYVHSHSFTFSFRRSSLIPIPMAFPSGIPFPWSSPVATYGSAELSRTHYCRQFLPRDAMPARYMPWPCVRVCVFVRLAQVEVLSKRLNDSDLFLAWELPSTYLTLSRGNSGASRNKYGLCRSCSSAVATGQTDVRTPYRYIDPAPHIMRPVPVTGSKWQHAQLP